MAALFGQDIPFLDSAYHPRTPDTSGTQSFFQGWQRAQEGKRLALEQAQQEAMLPLQQKQAQLQIQNAILDLAAKTRMADAALNIKAGQAALADKLANIDWSNPTDRASVWEIGKQFPDLLSTPIWEKVQENFINSDKAAAQALHWKNLSEESTARATALQAKLDAGTASQQDLAAASRLRQEAESLRAAGNATAYQDRIRQAEILETHIAPKGITIQTGTDDQGRPITTTSIGGGQPTTAMQSFAQKKQIGYEIALEGLTSVMNKVRPEDVGVRGVVGEHVADRYLAQVNPQFANQERIQNRAALRDLREQLIQAVSAEPTGRFTQQDVKRISDLASGLEASTSYPDLQNRFGELRHILASRSRTFAERTGTPIPDFAKTADEIKLDYSNKNAALKKAVQDNVLTADQAKAESIAARDRARNALQRYFNITE